MSCEPENYDSASYEFVSSWVVNWTICLSLAASLEIWELLYATWPVVSYDSISLRVASHVSLHIASSLQMIQSKSNKVNMY